LQSEFTIHRSGFFFSDVRRKPAVKCRSAFNQTPLASLSELNSPSFVTASNSSASAGSDNRAKSPKSARGAVQKNLSKHATKVHVAPSLNVDEALVKRSAAGRNPFLAQAPNTSCEFWSFARLGGIHRPMREHFFMEE
jgi:hypothetical protein